MLSTDGKSRTHLFCWCLRMSSSSLIIISPPVPMLLCYGRTHEGIILFVLRFYSPAPAQKLMAAYEDNTTSSLPKILCVWHGTEDEEQMGKDALVLVKQ